MRCISTSPALGTWDQRTLVVPWQPVRTLVNSKFSETLSQKIKLEWLNYRTWSRFLSLCIPCGGERLISVSSLIIHLIWGQGLQLNLELNISAVLPLRSFCLYPCQHCMLICFINATQIRFTRGEGTSIEDSPPTDWHVFGYLLNEWLMLCWAHFRL